MGRQDDSVKCLALALMNFSDDEGFFYADPAVVRAFARPFDDSSTTTRHGLETLSKTGFILMLQHPLRGPIGWMPDFDKHQRIDRKKPSDIKHFWLECESTNDRRAIGEGSTLEGKGMEGNLSTPLPPSGESKPKLPRKEPRPRGRDFSISALEMPEDAAAQFDRVWSHYPQKGWNFSTRTASARRINFAEAAKRFWEVVQFNKIQKTDGTLMTAQDLADATITWLKGRIKDSGGPTGIPNVPCIANFFSCVDGQKHHWKEAVLQHFGMVGVP